jgi:acyl-CoA synthetase (AMP-forming)/AMP-acid ligase II
LIISGRNYTPNQIESFVEALTESALTPVVVAVGLTDPTLLTEQLHLLLDVRLAAGGDRQAIVARVSEALAEVFGLGGVTFHWITGGEFPRTSSGKIQRYLCRKLVEERVTAAQPANQQAATSNDRPTAALSEQSDG